MWIGYLMWVFLIKHNKPEKVKEKEKQEDGRCWLYEGKRTTGRWEVLAIWRKKNNRKMEGVGYITAHSYVCISKVTQKTYMLVFTIQFWSTKPRSHEVFSRDSPTYITFALTKWSQRAEYGESISSSSGARVILLKSFLLFRFAPKLQQSWQTLQKGFNCFIYSFKLICRAFPLSKQSLISIDTAVGLSIYDLPYWYVQASVYFHLQSFYTAAN